MAIYYSYPGVSSPEFSQGILKPYRTVYKKFGTVSSTLTNAATTILYKFAMSANFSSIRLGIYNTSATPITGLKVAVAVTETNEQGTSGTDPVRAQPIIGGQAFPGLTTATDERGWTVLNWENGGLDTITIAAGTNASPTVEWTSTRSLISTPRTDGGVGPILMVRVYSTSGTVFTGVPGANFTPDPATHGDRTLYCASSAGDKVTLPTAGDSFASGPAGVCPIILEVQYDEQVNSLMVIGDSITQNDALVPDKYSCWGQRACVKRTAGTTKWEFWQQGASSQVQTDFWTQAKNRISEAGVNPSVMTFAAWSPNGTINRQTVSTYKTKILEFLDYCNVRNIYPILFTSGPNDTYDAATDSLRVGIVEFARELSRQGRCGLLDSAALWGTGTVPDRWKPEYKADDVHPNEAGIEVCAQELAKILPI